MTPNEIVGLLLLLHPFAAFSLDCVKLKDEVMETKLTTPMQWIEDAIKVHNKYRAEHDASPLTFNASLCGSAQWTANKILKIGFMHTSQMPEGYGVFCGENLYTSAGALKVRSPAETIDPWYAEELFYDYKTGKTTNAEKPVGHFTQLVWKPSKEMCIAYAMEGTRFFAAAHYYPRGNVKNRYVENVGLKKGYKSKDSSSWVEILCDKLPKKSRERRRFKCHFKGLFSQLSPKKELSLDQQQSKKLMNQVLDSQKISAFIETPETKSS